METNPFLRRDVVKTSGTVLGGLALGTTLGTTAVSAQDAYYRYESVWAQLVDVDTDPPSYQAVQTELYLPQPRLADCEQGRLDVLDYIPPSEDDDGDDADDGDDDADETGTATGDDGDDDDVSTDARACAGFAEIVLLCQAESATESIAMRGLIPDLLDGLEYDYIVALSPTEATNLENPDAVADPCAGGGEPTTESGDDTGDDDADDDTGTANTGDDADDGTNGDTGGDDDSGADG